MKEKHHKRRITDYFMIRILLMWLLIVYFIPIREVFLQGPLKKGSFCLEAGWH